MPEASIRFLAMRICLVLFLLASASSAFAQPAKPRGCFPVSERAGRDVGCWLIVSEPLGRLSQSAVFWHLDRYPSRAEAESAKGPRSTVVDALGQVWLFTIGEAGWRPRGGERVAEIVPLLVKAGEDYTAQYAEGISNPGDITPKHRHPGTEAWYTVAGEFCAEAADGKRYIAGAGQALIIQADATGWSMMTLVATGSEVRRSVWLVLHQTANPWTARADDWTPKGLCSL